MNIQQFISKAIEGGWNLNKNIPFSDIEGYAGFYKEGTLLDPLSWKSVAKIRIGNCKLDHHKNAEELEQCDNDFWENSARNDMRRFIDYLCDGLTLEEALEKATS